MAKIEVHWPWAFIALDTTNSAPRLALRSLATLAHPSLWGHLYFAELGTFLFCIDTGYCSVVPSRTCLSGRIAGMMDRNESGWE